MYRDFWPMPWFCVTAVNIGELYAISVFKRSLLCKFCSTFLASNGGIQWLDWRFGTQSTLLSPEASPRGGLGWTCAPHFCPRSILRLMQIRWVFTREEGFGVGPWILTKDGKWSKFIAFVWHQKLKGLHLQSGFAPWPTDQGLCSWTPLGASPPDPIIGLCCTCSRCVSTPHFLTWRCPTFSSILRRFSFLFH